jgi:hypothetical protein
MHKKAHICAHLFDQPAKAFEGVVTGVTTLEKGTLSDRNAPNECGVGVQESNFKPCRCCISDILEATDFT